MLSGCQSPIAVVGYGWVLLVKMDMELFSGLSSQEKQYLFRRIKLV